MSNSFSSKLFLLEAVFRNNVRKIKLGYVVSLSLNTLVFVAFKPTNGFHNLKKRL